MVRLWAEKEMRNLKRLVAAGIPCPEPIEVRENVLVMRFLGDQDGWYVFDLFSPPKKRKFL
jgi:RIO kinase 1